MSHSQLACLCLPHTGPKTIRKSCSANLRGPRALPGARVSVKAWFDNEMRAKASRISWGKRAFEVGVRDRMARSSHGVRASIGPECGLLCLVPGYGDRSAPHLSPSL
jgi:hypothetical protein